jgi:hypothetical protein
MTSESPADGRDESDAEADDCYPAVIGALTPGTLVTFNGSDDTTWGTDELRVEWAGEGEAGLRGPGGAHYTVGTDDGDLALFKADGEWPEWECAINTIEVVGSA